MTGISAKGSNVVWLASYPKCGNTWVRFMLFAALHGPPNESIEVSRRITDIHRPIPHSVPPGTRQIMKTHFMLTDRHPMLKNTNRAIHVIRDPRDVIISALNYGKLRGEDSSANREGDYIKQFIAAGGDANWTSSGFGTWAKHARSWRGTDRFPVLDVRYEELKANPRSELVRMLDFLGETIDDAKIDAAVKASSFESMRALEVREKQAIRNDAKLDKRLFIGDATATRKGVFFINKGKSGQSLDTFGRGLDAMLEARLGDAMREFGYLQ
ncbi:MAG: sulfotransferase domain-containing protein [Phycisphaerales bacterium]